MGRSHAAAVLGISPDAVRRLGDKGKLTRRQVGTRYLYEVPDSDDPNDVTEVFSSHPSQEEIERAALIERTITQPMRIPEEIKSRAPASSTPPQSGRQSLDPLVDYPAAPPGRSWNSAILADVHVPDHCKMLWPTFLRWLEDNREMVDELILLGDFGEFESMSAHGVPLDAPDLRQDIESVRQALEVLRRAAPDAVITYAEGNHETRPKRTSGAVLPRVASILDIPHLLGLDELGIGWVKEGRFLQRGGLHLVHGYWSSANAAKKHMDEYGFNIACGHVHRPQMFTKSDGRNRIRAGYVLPTMRDITNVEWCNGKPTGWTNGFSVNHVDDRGHYNLQMVLAESGRFIWNGKSYAP